MKSRERGASVYNVGRYNSTILTLLQIHSHDTDQLHSILGACFFFSKVNLNLALHCDFYLWDCCLPTSETGSNPFLTLIAGHPCDENKSD